MPPCLQFQYLVFTGVLSRSRTISGNTAGIQTHKRFLDQIHLAVVIPIYKSVSKNIFHIVASSGSSHDPQQVCAFKDSW